MLDIKYIRENTAHVKERLAAKHDQADIDSIIRLDENRRDIIQQVERLKAERNRVSGEIARKKKAKEPAEDGIAAMKQVGLDIARLDDELREVEARLHERLIWLPNLPHESVPVGQDETSNQFIRDWGEKPRQEFAVKPHWEIGEQLGILDIAAATRIAGAGFYQLRGLGALLQRALINYMLDLHTADGFLEVTAPLIVNRDTMFGTGQLPKLADDMYHVENDDMWLIPTAEVPVTNIYRGLILENTQLPLYLVAHTPCFRREAGAAGKDTRGMIRVHQFDKVEMVKIVRPETSYDELESLVTQAERVLRGLNLHYRVIVLATGDLSFASAKTYDLELWASGVGKYLEISSVSNFEDFQARRMNTRFRDQDKKVVFPHTLNGSGVALARLIPVILECCQNADGTVTIPEVLRPYMGGLDKIG